MRKFSDANNVRIMVYLAALIGFGIFLWVISEPLYYLTAILILLNMTVLALPFAMRKEIDFFEPVVIMILISQLRYTLRPVYWLLEGNISMLAPLDSNLRLEAVNRALIYNILGFVVYYFGYYSNIGRHMGRSVRRFSFIRNAQWNNNRVIKCIVILSIIGIIFYFIFVYINGGFTRMLAGWAMRSELLAGKTYFVWGFDTLLIASYVLFCFHLTVKRTFVTWIYIIFVASLLTTFGGRGKVVFFFLTFMIMYNYIKRKITIKSLLVFASIAILFFQAFLQLRRSIWFYGAIPELSAVTQIDYRRPDKILQSFLERPGFDFYAAIVALVPDKIPLQLGRTYLNLLAAPIPRKFWPGKPPINESSYVRQLLLPEGRGGRPIGNIGLFYFNFHIPGIVLGMFMLGLLHGALYTFLRRNIGNRNIILVYSIVVLRFLSLSNIAFLELTKVALMVGISLKFIEKRAIRAKYKDAIEVLQTTGS